MKLEIKSIYKFWHEYFSEGYKSIIKVCPDYLGMDFSVLKQSYQDFSLITIKDLERLKESLLTLEYTKNSKLNLFIGASTVPITPFVEILYSLILDIPIICRISKSYSLEFYEHFKSFAPKEIKKYIEFIHWDSEDNDIGKKIFEKADYIIIHANDSTIEKIKTLIPSNKKILTFGHKISFAIIDKNQITDLNIIIKKIKDDIQAFNQRGCLSPQLVYVINFKEIELLDFIKSLSQELKTLDKYLNPSQLYMRNAFLQEQLLIQKESKLFENILLSKDSHFNYNLGFFSIYLKSINNLNEIILDDLEDKVACIGHNLSNQELIYIQNRFKNTKIVDLGLMQRPNIIF